VFEEGNLLYSQITYFSTTWDFEKLGDIENNESLALSIWGREKSLQVKMVF